MGFLQCDPSKARQTHSNCGPHQPPNGLVQAPTVFLHHNQNGMRPCPTNACRHSHPTAGAPLENLCLPPPGLLPQIQSHTIPQLICLLKVYIDDFIGLIQASTPELQCYMHAILHAIHKIFPPAMVTHLPHDEPITLKKLNNGDGLWDTQKEILGWVFDVIM